VVAFFVGGAITGVFYDNEVEAETTMNNVEKLGEIDIGKVSEDDVPHEYFTEFKYTEKVWANP